MEKLTFKINHDDQPETIVDIFQAVLFPLGIIVDQIQSGDGYVIYEVKREVETKA
jgi:hypothetical protein